MSLGLRTTSEFLPSECKALLLVCQERQSQGYISSRTFRAWKVKTKTLNPIQKSVELMQNWLNMFLYVGSPKDLNGCILDYLDLLSQSQR